MWFDYETSLLDTKLHKQVPEKLPANIRNAGIYRKTEAWIKFRKKYGIND